ncbi:MAG: hypothetical protein AAFY15_06290 [Cyanobacteria bacterium J06648_11]
MTVSTCSLLTLEKRYHVDLDEVHRRLYALGIAISPAPDGLAHHATIAEAELPLLDALDRHLQAGGVLDEFPGAMLPEVLPPHDISAPASQALASVPRTAIVPRLRTYVDEPFLASEPERAIASVPDLRERFEFLDDCAERQWLLTTDQLSHVIGLKGSTIGAQARESGSFRWQAWSLTRIGKQGRESLWRIANARSVETEAIAQTKKKKKKTNR